MVNEIGIACTDTHEDDGLFFEKLQTARVPDTDVDTDLDIKAKSLHFSAKERGVISKNFYVNVVLPFIEQSIKKNTRPTQHDIDNLFGADNTNVKKQKDSHNREINNDDETTDIDDNKVQNNNYSKGARN